MTCWRNCLQCWRHEAPPCVLGVGLPYPIGVGHQMNHVEINHLLLDAESGASSQSGLGRRLPIRSQLVEVTLIPNG